jgi:RimJ/RimL family protein N-acetyltransferase
MGFELQPRLKGKLVELRPMQAVDFEVLHAVASDPLIWEQHPDNDRYKREVFEGYFRGGMESGGAFVALDAKDGSVIGSSRYHGYDAEKSEVEIGWTFLARKYWGSAGYNHEMKQLMIDHAFQFVDRIIFVVGVKNFRSQKAIEKFGVKKLGTKKDAKGRENVAYELRKEKFKGNAE